MKNSSDYNKIRKNQDTDYYVILDSNMNIIDCDDKLIKKLKLKKPIGKSCHSIFKKYENYCDEFLAIECYNKKEKCQEKKGKIIQIAIPLSNNNILINIKNTNNNINEIKQLKKESSFSKKIISMISEGIGITDLNHNILYLNDKLLKEFGKDSIGKKCYEVYRDNKKQCSLCPLKKKILPDEIKSIITDNVAGGKSFEIKHTLIEYNGKKAILEVFRDITDEEESKLELSKLKLGIERTKDIIFITDINGKINYTNPSFEKTYGYEFNEISNKTPRILKSGLQDNKFYKKFWKRLLSNKKVDAEIINKTKFGDLITVKASVNPIVDNNKNILGFLAIQRDITKEKEIEKEIIKKENLLIKQKKFSEKIIDTAPSIIIILNNKGNITLFNKYSEEILGYKKEEVLGKNWFDIFIIDNEKENIQKIFNKIMNNKTELLEYENKIKTKNGQLKDIYWKNTILNNKNKKEKMIISIGIDITQKNKNEKEMKLLQNNLKDRISELENFQKLTIGRELKMIELKEKIKKLEKKNG